MTDEDLPPPESCANNLYRAEDVTGKPVPSDLCRNAVGAFHMLDCPLFLGRPCTYYEEGAAERGVESDVALEKAARELREDFLGWRYTLRVRALSLPKDQAPERREVEPIDESDDHGAVREREAEGAEDSDSEIVEPEVDEAPAEEEEAEARVEKYPGQRRSEERVRHKPSARAEGDDEATDAPDDPEQEEEQRPLTVEDLLDSLPEAPLPDKLPPKPRRGQRGGRRRGRSRGGRSRGQPSGGTDEVEAGDSGTAAEGAGGESGKGRRRRGRGRRRRKGGDGAARPEGQGAGDGKGAGEGSGTGRRRRRRRRKPPRQDGSGGGSGA